MPFRLTEIVKHLLIINLLVFLAEITFPEFMMEKMALYPWDSDKFMPIQLVSHMFMHDLTDYMHILMNMIYLVMLGTRLEQFFGPKKFLIYYLVSGFGAAILHSVVNHFEYVSLVSEFGAENSAYFLLIPAIGASGAVFGLLMAFGYIFPNMRVMFIFPPIPVKVKYIVIGLGISELLYSMNKHDGIAHFAHLGGMLFGYLLLKYWRIKAV